MNKIFILLLILAFTESAWTQSTPKYTKIIDGGSIRSTPRLCEHEDNMKDLAAVTDPEFARQICPYAEEDKWPSAIQTLDKRNNGGRELLIQCNMYYVADIGDDAVLLWVPMEINKQMPADMRDKSDFLVVIGKQAVELGDKVSLYGDKNKEVVAEPKSNIDLSASGFENQLANVVADFQYGFKTIQGNKIPEKAGEMSFATEYDSKINLSGSNRTYLSKSGLSSSTTFIADFGDYDNKPTAVAKYKEIVGKIDKTVFPCCTFVKLDESVNESLISQGFLPFDLEGKMAPGFKNIVLEVEVMKTFKFTADFKTVDQWSVVLRVQSL